MTINKCLQCGQEYEISYRSIIPKDLVIHHMSYEPERVMIVCDRCHAEIHKRQGLKTQPIGTGRVIVYPMMINDYVAKLPAKWLKREEIDQIREWLITGDFEKIRALYHAYVVE